VQLRKDRPESWRAIADLPGADALMNEALFLGVYPGLTRDMLDYVVETIQQFVKRR
jgi:CDP-6-deoxy-D-xylo-4-hexulose-3-dehydrase